MKSSYANRGDTLEQIINCTNALYASAGIAKIDKFPTPVTVEAVRGGKVYGHYARKSIVDYVGVTKGGKFICFDCKETADPKKLSLRNILPHQIEYMKKAFELGGTVFLLVCFTKLNKYYRLNFKDLYEFLNNGGRASIPIEAFTDEVFHEYKYGLHYLKGIAD